MDLRYNLEKRPHLTLNPKLTLPKTFPPNPCLKKLSRETFPPNPYPKTHLPKMYPVNLIPKSNPEKRTRQNLTLKHYLEKRSHLTLTPKRISPKHTSRNLDKKGNRRVRAPELFREFRAASIFAHPTLGRGDLSVVCGVLKWAEVSGLRRGRAA